VDLFVSMYYCKWEMFLGCSAECGDAYDLSNTREYDRVLFFAVFLYQTIFPTEDANLLIQAMSGF